MHQPSVSHVLADTLLVERTVLGQCGRLFDSCRNGLLLQRLFEPFAAIFRKGRHFVNAMHKVRYRIRAI